MIKDEKQFDEFMEEIKSDIQQEKLMNIWKKYGKYITYGLSGIFGLTILHVFWKKNEIEKNEEAALKFLTAQNYVLSKDEKVAEKGMALLSGLSESSGAYAALSRFQEASLLMKKSEFKKAEYLYDKIISQKGLQQSWKDLATIYKVYAILDLSNDKGTDYKALKSLIKPLTDKERSFRFLALELMGFILFKNRDLKEASESFVEVAQSKEAPEELKYRCRLLSQMVSRDIGQVK